MRRSVSRPPRSARRSYPRRPGGGADDERIALHLAMGDVPALARRRDDELDRPLPHLCGIGADGGEVDAMMGRERDIVEADHRDVLGHALAAPLELVDR